MLIKIAGDDLAEGTESLRVVVDSITVLDAVGAPLPSPAIPMPRTVEIRDDDVRIGIRQITYITPEGGTPDPLLPPAQAASPYLRFFIDTLKAPTVTPAPVSPAGDIIINYAVTEASSSSADGADFAGGVLPTGQKTISLALLTNADANDVFIDIPINNDLVVEGTDRFVLQLTSARLVANPGGGVEILQSASQAQGQITNDDVPPVMLVSGQVAPEGSPSTITVSRPVSLSTTAMTVSYRVGVPEGTAPGQGLGVNDLLLDAASNQRFAGTPETGLFMVGELSFAAGQSTATMVLSTLADDLTESAEKFRIRFEASDPAYSDAYYDGVVQNLGGIEPPPIPDPLVLGDVPPPGP